MEFVLIYDWVNQDGSEDEQWVEWFDTKEQLLAACKEVRKMWAHDIEINHLYLSGAVHYSWADIENQF